MKALVIKKIRGSYITLLLENTISNEELNRDWWKYHKLDIRRVSDYYRYYLNKHFNFCRTKSATYKCSHCKLAIPPESNYIKIKGRKYHHECFNKEEKPIVEINLKPFYYDQIYNLIDILLKKDQRRLDFKFITTMVSNLQIEVKKCADVDRIIL